MDHIGKNYLFVRNIEGLKRYSSVHEAIIYDDLDLSRFNIQDLSELYISLFDIMNPSEVRVLYGSVHLPAGLVKIITTNNHSNYLITEAVRRRITHFKINKSLFKDNNSLRGEKNIVFEEH